MTLRLVSDNAEPGQPDYGNIPDMLRQYANELEAGQYGEVLTVALALAKPGRVFTLGCGDEVTPLEFMGLFEAAKLCVFADDLTEE
jgi:hypothetical protein